MTWHLYLIECCDGSLYAGISTNVDARYIKHSQGKGARYTRAKPPVRLVGVKYCGTHSDALKAEYAIRKLSPPEKIKFIQTLTAEVDGG
jgi:putative endonuclease